MHNFKRVHGDYTLDDPLDPELTMHQHFAERIEDESHAENPPKRLRIMADSQEVEQQQLILPRYDTKKTIDPPVLSDSQTRGKSNSDDTEESNVAGCQTPEQSSSPARRVTLGTLELYSINDTSIRYRNPVLQKLVDVATRRINLNHKEGLRDILFNISQLLVFTGSKICPAVVFGVIPRAVFAAVLGHDEVEEFLAENKWSRRLKSTLIRETTENTAERLRECALWPPPGASSELRCQFWEICFCLEVLELLFSTWLKGMQVVDIRAILSSPADSATRQWLWHLFVNLMEVRWKFDPKSNPTRHLRSGKTLGSSSGGSLAVEQVEQLSIAGLCVAWSTLDGVIDNFEHDVTATWNRSRVDLMDVDCTPEFGKQKPYSPCSDGTVRRIAIFASRLRERPSENFPAALGQHFAISPPGRIREEALIPVATNRKRERSRDSAPRSPRRPKTLILKKKSKRVHILDDSSEDDTGFSVPSRSPPKSIESLSKDVEMEAEDAGGLGKLSSAPRTEDRLFIPGAWDDEWEPEEKSFSAVSRTMFTWWTG